MSSQLRETGPDTAPRAAAPAESARPRPILLIEDTPSLQMVYRSVLASAGHRVAIAGTAAEGLTRFREVLPSVVLLDLMLPDRNGLDLMQDMLRLRPETNVIVITANGSINKAVEAMRAGAHEFLVKPFDEQRFLGAVENATLARPTPRARRPEPEPEGPASLTGAFLGSSETMARIHAKIRSAARSMATVFITGESGTGKELCALAVHSNSSRATGPFIALNCGAIPQDLLESEVFGHVKGSFTGAIADKPGAAAAADGGTLFLDEICEMAPALQTKLLRFLQTSMVQPVGATRPRKVNVRIVCATNRDPLDAVRRGHFREDLYYRLYVVPIHMPPLRERGDDVIEIAETALARFAAEEGREFIGLDPQVQALFRHHPWPGNVRQVLNVIRNIVVLNDGGLVTMRMLPDDFAAHPPVEDADLPRPPPAAEMPGLDDLIGRTLAEIEQIVIEATIARHGGSVPKAARVLDVSPSTLYRKRETWKS
ncbi:sigma-54 dependent transcriptional regulator [Cereibacter sphaeroides]|uniref:sigma-54-dependent transcriptional regulator n=1 Tax=Cereibacter sphaeroides TaxID=1063 RepID=UPI001F17899B|nr:sigma-54 dependent transcriptional regulator [Cereibacter sphaeroides]MCE6960138.1 sigma-54 dependent transcriptional regulator [Cereibacter sphaeroides]MCE6967920.1 sigma-54 dependent transcriptional regulator [Cereibacter sphaeroides]MCE6974749.1 sigma-54 dependent transcriptional regulator [Cereibacter sphaeroides]